MNATVYINGHNLGTHPYGYTTFFHDLTPHLKPGADNVLAVRVDQSKHRNSRWYAGSGIYRHVWLHATDPVHVAQWGTSVTTPEVGTSRAKILVSTSVENESGQEANVTLETVIQDNAGKIVGRATQTARVPVHPGQASMVHQDISVEQPEPWSPESPRLYRAVTRVMREGQSVDEVSTTFGIRSIEWSAEKGFLLNGKPVKMMGGCVHHDHGPLGAAAFDRAEERRVQLLKESGFNAVRTSHNPPSPAFLDACDRLGMLVMDEAFDCWSKGKNPFDYSVAFQDWWRKDIDAMVLRDRNHPSVVMWSIGNEIPERGEPLGAQEAKMLADYLRGLDRTRPITSALNFIPGKWSDTDGFYSALDIAGYNYNLNNHVEDHQRVPSRVMACTESYPQSMFDYWAMVNDFPYIVGDFVWTAVDYLGESGLGRWYYRDPKDTSREGYGAPFPYHGADCGDIDICGNRRAMAHYRNIVWNRGEKLFLGVRQPPPEGKELRVTRWGAYPVFTSWTWPGMDGKPLEVEIYSRAETVRLYLNDRVIGENPVTRAEKFKANFTVSYAPGTLRAVAMQDGRAIAESVLKTAGDAVQIRLTANRASLQADGQDLSFLSVEVVDAHGQPHPNADIPVTFSVQGPGVIAGVANADLTSEEPYHANQRKLFRGKALVVVRTMRKGGAITLTAVAPGLKSATIRMASRA
jgi:beta-galactosidase